MRVRNRNTPHRWQRRRPPPTGAPRASAGGIQCPVGELGLTTIRRTAGRSAKSGGSEPSSPTATGSSRTEKSAASTGAASSPGSVRTTPSPGEAYARKQQSSTWSAPLATNTCSGWTRCTRAIALRNGSATGLGYRASSAAAPATAAATRRGRRQRRSLLLSFNQPLSSAGCSPGVYPKSVPSDARSEPRHGAIGGAERSAYVAKG